LVDNNFGKEFNFELSDFSTTKVQDIVKFLFHDHGYISSKLTLLFNEEKLETKKFLSFYSIRSGDSLTIEYRKEDCYSLQLDDISIKTFEKIVIVAQISDEIAILNKDTKIIEWRNINFINDSFYKVANERMIIWEMHVPINILNIKMEDGKQLYQFNWNPDIRKEVWYAENEIPKKYIGLIANEININKGIKRKRDEEDVNGDKRMKYSPEVKDLITEVITAKLNPTGNRPNYLVKTRDNKKVSLTAEEAEKIVPKKLFLLYFEKNLKIKNNIGTQ